MKLGGIPKLILFFSVICLITAIPLSAANASWFSKIFGGGGGYIPATNTNTSDDTDTEEEEEDTTESSASGVFEDLEADDAIIGNLVITESLDLSGGSSASAIGKAIDVTGVDIVGLTVTADQIQGNLNISSIPFKKVVSKINKGKTAKIKRKYIKGLNKQLNLKADATDIVSYTAGTGIDITNDVISSTAQGTTYTAGTGISITNDIISSTIVDTDTTYTAGANIAIDSNNEISATDTNTVYTAGNGINLSGTEFAIDLDGATLQSTASGLSVNSITASKVSDFDAEVTNNVTVAANAVHVAGDGTDHAEVAANTVHTAGDGSDHADVAANTTHLSSTGADHSYIDQDVTIGSTPTFDGTNFTNVPVDYPDYYVTNVSELTAAVAAASAGDTIKLAPGTYTLTETLTIGTDGLTIQGAGIGQTIIEGSFADSLIDINGTSIGGYGIAAISQWATSGVTDTAAEAGNISEGNILSVVSSTYPRGITTIAASDGVAGTGAFTFIHPIPGSGMIDAAGSVYVSTPISNVSLLGVTLSGSGSIEQFLTSYYAINLRLDIEAIGSGTSGYGAFEIRYSVRPTGRIMVKDFTGTRAGHVMRTTEADLFIDVLNGSYTGATEMVLLNAPCYSRFNIRGFGFTTTNTTFTYQDRGYNNMYFLNEGAKSITGGVNKGMHNLYSFENMIRYVSRYGVSETACSGQNIVGT